MAAQKTLGFPLRKTDIQKLILFLIHDSHEPYSRWFGHIEEISQASDESTRSIASSILLEALSVQDNEVRCRAAYGLGFVGKTDAIPQLIKSLDQDPEPHARSAAAQSIGLLADSSDQIAAAALIRAMSNSDSYILSFVIESLKKLDCRLAVPFLIAALQNDSSDVCRCAAQALAKLDNETPLLSLFEALNAEDMYKRRQAAKTLGDLGNKSAIPRLIEQLQDSESSVRFRVAEALANLGNEAGIHELLEKLKKSSGPSEQSSATSALEKIGNPASLPFLWREYKKLPAFYLYPAIDAIQNSCKFYSYEIAYDLSD